MRPRSPASLLDLAWLVGLLPLAMLGGVLLWWGSGIGCDTECDNPFTVETVVWCIGVASALATFWLPRARLLLTLATIALLVPFARLVVVVAS